MREGDLQPFLVAFPTDDGGQQVMLDPHFFQGPDEVGEFLVGLARQYAQAFVDAGKAMDTDDAMDRIRELIDLEWDAEFETEDDGD